LRPSSLLVEVFEQISGLKDSIISTKEKEDELRQCIKDLSRSDKIYTCSYTLETIVS
jgi:cell division protein FtsL